MKQDIANVYPTSRLYQNEKNWADKVYLRQPIHGQWHEYTWGQTMEMARKVASFLKAQGIEPGDRVASLSKNCAEWFIMDFAIMIAGAVSVPLYAMQTAEDIEFILKHSGAKMIFVGKLDNWQAQEKGIHSDMPRVAFPYDTMPAEHQWQRILEDYEPLEDGYIPRLDELCTILYTSGTTGKPKGVMFTYEILTNFSAVLEEDCERLNFPEHLNLISYLPLAHCFERAAIELFSIGYSADVSFVESLNTFADNLREVSPTVFVAVPRIWSVFQQKILEKLPQKKLDTLLKIPLISLLIKKKIKKSLGLSNAVLCVSGAAPLPVNTLEWFEKLGIKIHEGYGMTENMAYTTLTYPGDVQFGAIGKARLGVELKIGDHNELLVKAPSTMAGYYNDPELTKKVLGDDGFLKTGDIAQMDDNGFIYIKGRLKEQFKTAKGEFILPVPIENNFAKNTDIEQCCVIGTGLRQPIIVATLSASAKAKNRSTVEKEVKDTFEKINHDLPNYSKLSHVVIVHDEWTPENDMLTATLKLKRRNIESKYSPAVNDAQKDGDDHIIWAA